METEQRLPSDAEKHVLAKYVGWGAFGQLFQPKFRGTERYENYHEIPDYYTRHWSNADKEHWDAYKLLSGVATPEEFQEAWRSSTNAHYTSPEVIGAMWDGVRRLGFGGGRVLEPAAGVGHFFGFEPEDLTRRSVRTAVELDGITGRICRYLYPNARVQIKGFQDARIADDSQDLIISNVPFGNIAVHDPEYERDGRAFLTESVHNYFFAKGLDKTRPGGVVAFITSHHTLDAPTHKRIRDYLAKEAHFLGAVRLPNNAFQQNAGTKVTTDIIFLQKRDPAADLEFESEHPRDAQGRFIEKWTEAVPYQVAHDGEASTIQINEYYRDHPEMLLGTMGAGSGFGQYPGESGMIADGRDLGGALHEAMARLPENVMRPADDTATRKLEEGLQEASEFHKPMSFLLQPDASGAPQLAVNVKAGRHDVGYLYSLDELFASMEGHRKSEAALQIKYRPELEKGLAHLVYDPQAQSLLGWTRDGTIVIQQNAAPAQLPALLGPGIARDLLQSHPGAEVTYPGYNPKDKEAPTIVGHHLQQVKYRPYSFDKRAAHLMRHFGHLKDNADTRARLRGMIALRDVAQDLIAAQYAEPTTDAELEAKRSALNAAYDRFQEHYGFLHDDKNRQLFASDPDAGLLLALEKPIVVEVPEPKNKSGVRKVLRCEKESIFFTRTATPYTVADHADTPEDALIISLRERGRIHWPYIGELLNRDVGAVRDELAQGRLIFRDPEQVGDPEHDGWVPADDYLSGNVRQKLAIARDDLEHWREQAQHLQAMDGGTQRDTLSNLHQAERNVAALADPDVQPKDLLPGQIDAKLGAPWIPNDVLDDFLRHLTGAAARRSDNDLLVTRSAGADRYYVREVHGGDFTRRSSEFGTRDMLADEILGHVLNLKDPIIYKRTGKITEVNERKTEAARDKAEKVRREFARWWKADPERMARLTNLYNEKFNALRLRQWDGQHLDLPGMDPAIKATRFPHIKDATWRLVQTGRGLLDHVVGAGKTSSAAATAMELRRLGLGRKNMVAVPNHMLEQWDREFRQMYPGAKVLTVWARDWTPEKRRTMTDRIATGDWDAVLITHKALEQIPVSEQLYEDYIAKEKGKVEAELMNLDKLNDSDSKKTAKDVRKQLDNFEARVKKRIEAVRSTKDDSLRFDELGIDNLIVDEFDLFKNLFFPTKMTRVAGISRSESGRAMDMYIKSRFLLQKNRGRGFYGLSGTPISNSMAEMYTLKRYFMEDELERLGLNSFDSWVATFGEPVTSTESAPEGGYRVKTRLTFSNVPEMVTLYRSFTDVKSKADLPYLPIPDHGDYTHVAEPSPAMKSYMADIRRRAYELRNGRPDGSKVEPTEDNFLKLTVDARKASLDLRLVDPSAPDDPGSKINQVVRQVVADYHEGNDRAATQLVFLDLGTPKGEKEGKAAAAEEEADAPTDGETLTGDEQEFRDSIYADIRKKLIASGILAEQIAFAHDFNTDEKKKARNDGMNTGSIRVLLGSTEKMGAGLNVQKRLYAEHHVDCPWRPRDLEQREGRILRQGNLHAAPTENAPQNWNTPVKIHRYVTKGTFDEYMWQTVKNKAEMIGKTKRGLDVPRDMDDIDEVVLNYASVMAESSENPLIKESIDTEAKVKKLRRLRDAHHDEKFLLQSEVRHLPQRADQAEQTAARHDQVAHEIDDAARLWEQSKPAKFRMQVGGKKYDGSEEAAKAREAAGSALLQAHARQARHAAPGSEFDVGRYGDFTIAVAPNPEQYGEFYATVKTPRGQVVGTISGATSPAGVTTKIDNVLRGLSESAAEHRQAAQNYRQQAVEYRSRIPRLEAQLKHPFEHEAELTRLEDRMTEINRALQDQMKEQEKERQARETASDDGGSVPLQKSVAAPARNAEARPVLVRLPDGSTMLCTILPIRRC